MRYKLFFSLENEVMPIDYRKNIISFIKLSLQNYDELFFEKYYFQKDTIIKPYSFSVFFRQAKIQADKILVHSKYMEMNITIEDYETAIIMYNAFNHQRNKKISINQNSLTLNNITLVPEKEINDSKCIIKFQSPLCVRLRENNKDFYYSYEHENFEDILKLNIRNQLSITNFQKDIVDTFKINPINAKKVVVKFYEKSIECSVGTFELAGNPNLLNYLYKVGIGSKHSAGFGMFQII